MSYAGRSLRSLVLVALLALAGSGCALRSDAPCPAPRPDPQAEAASLARGRVLYDNYCEPCHGARGEGDGPLAAEYDPRPTNLVAQGLIVSTRGIELVIQMPHYSSRLIQSRVTTGNREMPAWGEILTKQEIDDLVAYTRLLIAMHAAGTP